MQAAKSLKIVQAITLLSGYLAESNWAMVQEMGEKTPQWFLRYGQFSTCSKYNFKKNSSQEYICRSNRVEMLLRKMTKQNST
uniref:Uncharacterized protein n=1 Tax=Oryza sativa subsp. japonica TaxID=39947 RepID=Q6ESP8_ORYSJ|nr:hypothetical protein [Oryza sativa Japonica Group]BAD28322.1 hypothetical protein [Oryza sativa Japonica Group]